jgi:predicted nucleic acid-binding protein
VIVLDAAALADLLLEPGAKGEWVAGTIAQASSLHAPHLVDVEVASVVRRHTLSGALRPSDGAALLDALTQLRLTRYPATPLLERIYALRDNLSAYDATYVALAEALEVPLVTTDEGLVRAPAHVARVLCFPG